MSYVSEDATKLAKTRKPTVGFCGQFIEVDATTTTTTMATRTSVAAWRMELQRQLRFLVTCSSSRAADYHWTEN